MNLEKRSNKRSDGAVALRLATLIVVGAALGMVLGLLFNNPVAGIIGGAGAGVLIGSVLQVFHRHADRLDMTPVRARPLSLRWLLGCLAFLGVSAIFGGVVLVGSPTGLWLHIPLSVLQYSPFSDFLIPGLILGVVFGVGSLGTVLALWWRPEWRPGAVMTRFTREYWAWSAALGLGVGQIIWIVTETVMLRGASWLGFVYGSIGIGIVVLACQPGLRRYFALDQAIHTPANSHL